jgi:hypothetical protein
LSRNLAYIKSNFSKLATTITQLETTGVELCRGLELVKNVESELNVAHGMVGDNVFAKLQSVLHQNKGYSTICKISDILSGKQATFEEDYPELSSNDFRFFKYSPITSCDVERSFSRYKTMLSDNRRSFLFENFTMHVIYCNSKNDSDD